ncbi:MAG: DUF4142 domain-containing protein [Deltaproteobacteria bacterium]|nr:DUF4142 domain-containing protein [Deltaproteobacteria bacterium]
MRPLMLHALRASLILSAALAAAQDAGHHHPGTPDPSGGTGMGGVEAPPTLQNEGEIFAILAAADRAEITEGTYARTHARSRDVRSYGRMMVTMHTAASNRMSALSRRLRISPLEGAESRSLTREAAATQAQLARLTGDEFDRAYLSSQITEHEHLLEMLDRTLIPSARTAELRTALQNDVRPMVSSHLARARTLRERL